MTIKDIPQNCCLGQDNPAVPENYQPKDRDEGVKLDLIKNGETIKYYEGDTEPTISDFKETYEARITKGKPLFGSKEQGENAYHPKKLADVHTEITNALYFMRICRVRVKKVLLVINVRWLQIPLIRPNRPILTEVKRTMKHGKMPSHTEPI